ncbi:hypothetical protein [Marmoricola sp. RAF53]|uniref:hypothetical protein n=1 Tax=Marmoricola sp. RAF53 TaxID=3233059 RepID=UPI003F945FDE
MLAVAVAVLCVLAGLSWLVLLEPHLTVRQRLHHLGYGGDSFTLLAAGAFLGAGIGLLVGSWRDAPVTGALLGAGAMALVWAFLVAATSSLRRPAPDGHHRRGR